LDDSSTTLDYLNPLQRRRRHRESSVTVRDSGPVCSAQPHSTNDFALYVLDQAEYAVIDAAIARANAAELALQIG
jgi:hypothetical protein